MLIFALLMLTALIAPLIAEKFKLPGIIGLIVAGILLGPHGLGILERGLEVELLGTVGLLYIMFLAGLELDLIQFKKHKNHSIIFGILTFSIPLILGTLMGRYLLNFSWPAAVLLSTMFSSHTLITYPIASRLELTKQRAVTATIGGTLFTDTAALLVLAVIAASHKGSTGISFWIQLSMHMIIYIAAAIIILPRICRWFFRNIASDGIVAFTGVLGAAFLSSHMAHIAGLEPIIGAFLAGLVLNRLIPENSTLMNRIQFVGHSLFIPFFLISVGMLVNINLLLTGGTAAFIALSMVTAGMTTKFLAALMTKEILSYTKNEGMLIYGLTVNQAAATLAAVLVGYNIGIFTEPVLTGTIIMILITSLSGSWLTDKYARKIALSKENKPYSSTGRSQRILIPLANPHTAEELMSLAMMMRKKDSHEPLYPLTVVQSGDKTEERIAEAEKLLGSAVVKALSADVPVTPVTRSALDVASGIKQASTDLRISTIIAGWKGSVSSHSRTFGHILDSVKTDSTQMLLISRCINPVNTFKRIILAVPPLFEYQPGFTTAVNSAITLAQQMGVSMSIAAIPDTRRHIRSILEKNQTKIKTEELSITNWNDTPVFIKNNIKKKDELLVLLSVRKGRIAWQPLLSKMPRIITEKIKDINLVVLYPPERPCSKSIISPDVYPSEYKTLLPPHHIQPNLKNTELKKAVYLLLSCGFGHNLAPVMEITRQLTGENSKEPMELTPGALLIHAHITGINSSTAFLGINKNGWKTTYTTEKARVLFILLSPRDATPEIHLKALAYLAGPLHRENAMDKILSAKSAGAISRIFHQKKRSKGKLDNKP